MLRADLTRRYGGPSASSGAHPADHATGAHTRGRVCSIRTRTSHLSLSELRRIEPRARAFIVFESDARSDAGPYSDLDLRVITAGEPVERDRVQFLGGSDRPLLHVSMGTRATYRTAAR
jgi:hypothetical protein